MAAPALISGYSMDGMHELLKDWLKRKPRRVIAEKLDVSERQVSRWKSETNFPTDSNAEGLAEILGLTLDELEEAIAYSKANPYRRGGPRDEQDFKARRSFEVLQIGRHPIGADQRELWVDEIYASDLPEVVKSVLVVIPRCIWPDMRDRSADAYATPKDVADKSGGILTVAEVDAVWDDVVRSGFVQRLSDGVLRLQFRD